MTRVTRFLLLCVLLCGSLAPASAGATGSEQAAGPSAALRLRVGVTTDGIVQIGPADLAAAGVDPATVDPRTFAMTSMGQIVAIRVTGEADGRFDTQDRLLFFGQKFRGAQMEEKYTDERVYWLDIGGAAGPRIASIDAAPQGTLTPPADFPTTVHAEESLEWWTLHTLTLDTQDSWFWARLRPPIAVGSAITVSLPYTVPHPAPGTAASFRLEEISRAYTGPNPDHRTTIALNGRSIVDQTWSDKQRRVFTAALPAGVLAHGTNEVQVGAWTMPGNVRDDVYANYWEVDYRRLFRAWEGRLDFVAETSGAQEYSIQGWKTSQVLVWNVSDPLRPVNLDAAAVEGNHRVFLPLIFGRTSSLAASAEAVSAPNGAGALGLRFRAEDQAGARYWLQETPTFQRPASLRMRPDTGLRNPAGGADAVIVGPAILRPASEQLAAWHRANGRRALVVNLQDVYDEFNDGILHPRAVPAMLAWAATHWEGSAPAYLTLMGDGDWNFKGFNPAAYPPGPNYVPPYLAWVDPWQGEVPADALYGDLDGDLVPEVAVGRLAVNTLAQATTVVNKIVNYDQTVRSETWQRRALFIADNADSAGNFPAVSDVIIATHLPSDLIVQRAYLPDNPTPGDLAAVQTAISQALQSGAWLVQYTGHGATNQWTGEGIWRTSDVSGLTNGAKLPVVMTFDCLDGYFAHPDPTLDSLAETMQRHAGGGSIAAISASGLGITNDQLNFRIFLMDVLFRDGVRELGRALTIAKRQYYQVFGPNYQIQTMTLFGDPALRLPGPASAALAGPDSRPIETFGR